MIHHLFLNNGILRWNLSRHSAYAFHHLLLLFLLVCALRAGATRASWLNTSLDLAVRMDGDKFPDAVQENGVPHWQRDIPDFPRTRYYSSSVQEVVAFRTQCVALATALLMTGWAAVVSLRELWRWRFRIHDPSLKATPISTPQLLVGLFEGRMLATGLVALIILGSMFLPARELEVELYWVHRLFPRRSEWGPVEHLAGGIGLMILGLTFYVHRVAQVGIVSREYRLITRALFYPVFVFVSLAILIASKATGYLNQLTLIWQFPIWLGALSLVALHPKMPFWNREQ